MTKIFLNTCIQNRKFNKNSTNENQNRMSQNADLV